MQYSIEAYEALGVKLSGDQLEEVRLFECLIVLAGWGIAVNIRRWLSEGVKLEAESCYLAQSAHAMKIYGRIYGRIIMDKGVVSLNVADVWTRKIPEERKRLLIPFMDLQ